MVAPGELRRLWQVACSEHEQRQLWLQRHFSLLQEEKRPFFFFPSRITYEVTMCPIAGPLSACITQRTGGPSRRRMLEAPASVITFDGLDPLTT